MFVDRHKRTNIIENQKIFFKIVLDLKSFLVIFDSKRNMKDKVYLNDSQVTGTGQRLVIMIIYDECTFCVNNGKTHIW